MKRIVLDVSVILKWFIEEEDSDRAIKIRDLYVQGKIRLSLPVLVLFELGNTLLKHPSITLEDSETAFQALLDLGMEFRSFVEAKLLKNAFKISREFNITFYDAAYVVLSKLYGTKFITADKGLYDKIKDSFDVLLLRNVEPESLL